MRTHTTFTDIRHIMKLHEGGMSAEDICQRIFIDVDAIKFVIDQRSKPVKKYSKKVE